MMIVGHLFQEIWNHNVCLTILQIQMMTLTAYMITGISMTIMMVFGIISKQTVMTILMMTQAHSLLEISTQAQIVKIMMMMVPTRILIKMASFKRFMIKEFQDKAFFSLNIMMLIMTTTGSPMEKTQMMTIMGYQMQIRKFYVSLVKNK